MAPAADPGRGLTAESFASLLGRLGADPESAGAAYENLRRSLVAFFTWRGATTPEDCADETLDRLAARLEGGLAVQEVARFARGIARLVLFEHWRAPESRAEATEGIARAAEPPAGRAEEDRIHDCLEGCLQELPVEGRELILEYYSAEGRARIAARKRIAERLSLSESALRNRAQRLRDRLEACLSECLCRTDSDTKP